MRGIDKSSDKTMKASLNRNFPPMEQLQPSVGQVEGDMNIVNHSYEKSVLPIPIRPTHNETIFQKENTPNAP